MGLSLMGGEPRGAHAQQSGGSEVERRIPQAGEQDGTFRQSESGTLKQSSAAETTAAIQSLIQQLQGGSFRARRSAAMARVLADPEAKAAVVPVLIAILEGEDQTVSAAAAEALAMIGADAEAALSILNKRAADESADVRQAAERAVRAIRRAMAERNLSVTFEDGALSVRADHVRLGRILEEVSRAAKIAITMGDGVAGQRLSAEFSDQPLDQGLRQMLQEHDAFFYYRGKKGLQLVWVYPKDAGVAIQPLAPDMWASTKEIAEGLSDPEPKRRAESIRQFVERTGAAARDEVLGALSDEDPWVRTAALEGALYEGIDLSPDLLTRLATSDPAQEVRFLALQALPDDPSTERVALKALQDPSPHVRAYARQFLNRLELRRNPPERRQGAQTPPQQ